jgi:hypothetical protein
MDKKINELIDAYIHEMRNKGIFTIPISKDSTHKNYKYFEQIIKTYGNIGGWDPVVFIRANLETKTKYPAQLNTKTAFNAFKDYKMSLNTINKDEKIVQSFVNTVETIIAKVGKYDPYLFFESNNENMSKGLACYLNGSISKYYCVVNKPFLEKIRILSEDIGQFLDIDELKIKRAFILNTPLKLRNELKKIMNKDYWI